MWRRPAVVAGVVLVIGSLVTYGVGSLILDPTPPPCFGSRSSCYYNPSDRERWQSSASPWTITGVLLGMLTAWFGLVWRFVRDRPRLRKVGSIVGLVVNVLVTALFAFLFVAILSTRCPAYAYVCLEGPWAATVVGSPGLVTAALSALLVTGLARQERPVGRWCSTLALTSTSGAVVLGITSVALVAAGV